MKKIFTILAAAMTVLCAYAADVTVALSQMTPGTGSYSYEGTEVVAKKNNVYIELPAEEVTVSATFEVEATAVDNTEAAVKTVKVVRDGQVLILRDGKIFNLMGTELN
ncbi:MAG: hypothetical protein IJS92_03460 [Paludibacteraceae bacterium]|nr:hypothetical protein [Paludibacteraceae bacterium]